MNDKTKKILKKIFPLGLLVWASYRLTALNNKFAYFGFLRDWKNFKQQSRDKNDHRFNLSGKNFYPILFEKTASTNFDRHYVYHPAWAVRKVIAINPAVHIDISSTLHFCAQLSAVVPVQFFDYRPADLKLSNLSTGKADLLNLPFPDNSIESISCMHTVEHIGTGRYGEPINPVADLQAMRELARVVAPGGSLLFVTPVGRPQVMFNAQRVYSFEQICEAFAGLRLEEFSLVPDVGDFINNADPDLVKDQINGCGCFWFKK